MPGSRYLPWASICWAPEGTATAARAPTSAMRSPSVITAESGIGASPVPSMRVAPSMAVFITSSPLRVPR